MTNAVELFIALLVVYQVKHLVADFVLQNVWMLQKSSPGWNFVLPLSIHCGVHAGATLVIAFIVRSGDWKTAIGLAFFDFVVHFAMDRIKAGPRYLGRFSDMRSKGYWMSFGLDQMIHHLTHMFICWYLVFG